MERSLLACGQSAGASGRSSRSSVGLSHMRPRPLLLHCAQCLVFRTQEECQALHSARVRESKMAARTYCSGKGFAGSMSCVSARYKNSTSGTVGLRAPLCHQLITLSFLPCSSADAFAASRRCRVSGEGSSAVYKPRAQLVRWSYASVPCRIW